MKRYMRELGSGNNIIKTLLVLCAVILVIVAGYSTYVWQKHKVDSLRSQVTSLTAQVEVLKKQNQQPTLSTTYTSTKGVKIIVYSPAGNTKVASPVAIIGEVPGNWSFEASFPAKLKNSAGIAIAQGPAQVLGNWMTDQLVPFATQLTYTATPSGSGVLVLQKDNPSGLTQNDDSVSIPVQF